MRRPALLVLLTALFATTERGVLGASLSIAVHVVCTDVSQAWVMPALQNKISYATLHGYPFYISNHINKDRHPAWSKISQMSRYLRLYDWVWQVDLDYVIMNMSVPLTHWLDEEKDMVVASDCNGVNTGSWLVKNTTWSQHALHAVWRNNRPKVPLINVWWEQAAFRNLLETDPTYSEHVKVIGNEGFNSWDAAAVPASGWGCRGDNPFLFKDGDFAVHFAGQDKALILPFLQQHKVVTPPALSLHHMVLRPIPPLKSRDHIGHLLQQESFTVGVELGVQRGEYAATLLRDWTNCEHYHLVDLWAQQKNYKDIANVGDDAQNVIYDTARENLKQWKAKISFYRMTTQEAAGKFSDESIDFVYVDARHDYCGVKEDIELYWPKIRQGGILAGHDYKSAGEVSGQDWSVCMDGTINVGAVRGAVDEFAAQHMLQVVVTYRDEWNTWLIRKP